MASLFQDYSGPLLKEVFYELSSLPEWMASSVEELELRGVPPHLIASLAPKPDWILSTRESADLYAYAELIIGRVVEQRDCPLDPTHVTSDYPVDPRVELFGGPRLSDVGLDDVNVITRSLAERLQRSRLVGYRFIPLRITNQSQVKSPELSYLHFAGRNCVRPRVVLGGENACPYCQRSPLICPGCGHTQHLCLGCGKRCIFRPSVADKPDDAQMIIEELNQSVVIEGSRWDGSDFFDARFVGYFTTGRALKWLLNEGVAPLQARPCFVHTEGMDATQLSRLEAARIPIH